MDGIGFYSKGTLDCDDFSAPSFIDDDERKREKERELKYQY